MSPTAKPVRPPLEIGIVIAGLPDTRERHLITRASALLWRELRHAFPNYDWRVATVDRPAAAPTTATPSSVILRRAAELRDERRWDFIVMVTGEDLVALYRPFALAALSRPLDAAVISTARLFADEESPLDDAVLVDRLATLCLHAIAHLGGEARAPERDHFLFRPESPADLDAMSEFDAAELEGLDRAFAQIADARLEETEALRGPRWRFLVRAARINRGEIVDAVIAARPWEFPRHLSRLTTAAVSTVAILLMTAESWDLGLSQGTATLMTMALLVLAFTTAFVVARQQLLVTRGGQLREQIAVTGISAVLIVTSGLATTWVCMFALALLASSTLFSGELISEWAGSLSLDPGTIGPDVFVRMSCWCASIGLLIGSLGASFEDQHHFQHVIFVDEEL